MFSDPAQLPVEGGDVPKEDPAPPAVTAGEEEPVSTQPKSSNEVRNAEWFLGFCMYDNFQFFSQDQHLFNKSLFNARLPTRTQMRPRTKRPLLNRRREMAKREKATVLRLRAAAATGGAGAAALWARPLARCRT